jgi:hypothetical protein
LSESHDIDHDEAGFESDGRGVPAIKPDIYFDDPPSAASDFDIEPFIDFLILGCKTPRDIGEKVLFLAFLMRGVARRPDSYTALGAWMNVSGTTAKARLEAFKPIFIGEIQSLLEKAGPL